MSSCLTIQIHRARGAACTSAGNIQLAEAITKVLASIQSALSESRRDICLFCVRCVESWWFLDKKWLVINVHKRKQVHLHN